MKRKCLFILALLSFGVMANPQKVIFRLENAKIQPPTDFILKSSAPKKSASDKKAKKENPKLVLESLTPEKKALPKQANEPSKSQSKQAETVQKTVSGGGRQSVIALAKKQIGVRYRFGGSSPSTGFDCSGLMVHVFKANGIVLPRTSHEQFSALTPVSEPQAGDLVFFNHGNRRINHVGLYLGNGQMLHAPSSGKRVEIQDIWNNPYWRKRYVGARSAFKRTAVAHREQIKK